MPASCYLLFMFGASLSSSFSLSASSSACRCNSSAEGIDCRELGLPGRNSGPFCPQADRNRKESIIMTIELTGFRMVLIHVTVFTRMTQMVYQLSCKYREPGATSGVSRRRGDKLRGTECPRFVPVRKPPLWHKARRPSGCFPARIGRWKAGRP